MKGKEIIVQLNERFLLKEGICEISALRRGVVEVSALLGFNAA
jgi:hypothetical protein